ncbi:helix-turn-helix domain-containing protein [uncultured Spongiibacter sp.]|uniref:helix-turn-helix domain-containing protein n=1 Tax=uncultured Spongiibacter sp. TaxID=870896 RepID=UPI0019602162
MLKAAKVRYYLISEQEEFLNSRFDPARFVNIKSLFIISTQYKRHGLKLSAR